MSEMQKLRMELNDVIYRLKTGEITHQEATSFAVIAGKLISSCKVEIEYNVVMQNRKKIDFLE